MLHSVAVDRHILGIPVFHEIFVIHGDGGTGATVRKDLDDFTLLNDTSDHVDFPFLFLLFLLFY